MRPSATPMELGRASPVYNGGGRNLDHQQHPDHWPAAAGVGGIGQGGARLQPKRRNTSTSTPAPLAGNTADAGGALRHRDGTSGNGTVAVQSATRSSPGRQPRQSYQAATFMGSFVIANGDHDLIQNNRRRAASRPSSPSSPAWTRCSRCWPTTAADPGLALIAGGPPSRRQQQRARRTIDRPGRPAADRQRHRSPGLSSSPAHDDQRLRLRPVAEPGRGGDIHGHGGHPRRTTRRRPGRSSSSSTASP